MVTHKHPVASFLSVLSLLSCDFCYSLPYYLGGERHCELDILQTLIAFQRNKVKLLFKVELLGKF